MTSETEAIKTNEFLRRRKLRLQQVREQSKDIAKKIRQRAKVEKLRQVVDLDAKKQKEYFECQEKLVKRLEVLYAKGLENVGASHHSATEFTEKDEVAKTDLSKLRGKEATAELRKKKQEKLDQQKKLLERKVQAREVANEISREKSSVVANRLLSKSSSTKVSDDPSQKAGSSSELANSKESNRDAGTSNNEGEAVKTIDMATQWDMATIPEWERVPELSLPTDKLSPKDSDDLIGSKADKSNKIDLFALSKDMPSSLRGKHTHEIKEREAGRPSLTIVSEYLQNRKLRLRETEPIFTNKKAPDDMQSLKQTIERTRSTKPEGIPFNVCQVHDQQIIPVPAWRAERNCQFCSQKVNYDSPVPSRQFQSVTNAQINQIFGSIRPVRQANIQPSPVVRGKSPFRRSKVDPGIISGKAPASKNKSMIRKSPERENDVQRKSSVLMYNHSTRDTRDLPYGDRLVVRDLQSEEDAYSQAMREVSALSVNNKEQRKVQDMRNKVAVTKQNVEKEYKDTMNFLNSLPKDKGSKVIKNAYMDERRHQMQHESRQQKMQQEYKKIEKECKKHNCSKSRNQSKSPVRHDMDDNFDSRDFQLSWMPVPETDGNLAIHTIPNTVKQGKSGNSVKFSQVDSYHEYRSRHKHTPPTKDTQDNPPGKRRVETVVIDKNTTESSDSSSITSDTSSLVNMRVEKKRKHRNAKEINQNLSDAERIIIYKVLDSKTTKKSKKQTKLLNEIAKSLTCIGKVQKQETENTTKKRAENAISFEQLNEGIYKMVEEQGAGYKMSCCTTNVEMWKSTTPLKPWWDNVTSIYYDAPDSVPAARSGDMHRRSCRCESPCKRQHHNRGTFLHWESGECPAPATTTNDSQWPNECKENPSNPPPSVQSSVPSTSSIVTVANDKGGSSEGGYIKLVDETGHEAGKFFIDSSGLLNNNAYEVVIQLRKKDKLPQGKIPDENTVLNHNLQSGKEIHNSGNENNLPTSCEPDVNDVQLTSDEDRRNILGNRNDIDHQSSKTPPQPDPTTTNIFSKEPNMPSDNNEKCHIKTIAEGSDDVFFKQSTSENKKKMREKGVHTSLTEGTKSDPLPRPSTTTYTQTTLSSPTHRPVFFHMSSSTSTAYMSPPEMILPKFLRHDYATTEEEAYDPIRTFELIGKEYREEFADCACRKCVLANKSGPNQVDVPVNCNKKYETKRFITSPNTANSSPGRRQAIDVLKGRNVPCKRTTIDKPMCTHYNRGKADHVKRHCHRNKRPKSSRNANTHDGIDLTSGNRYKFASSCRDKKPDQSRLNPIIRDYVNKLLALNREGLKAVEVAAQECSPVGTPGSSIINVPFNVDERKSSRMNTISLEQIKNLIKRQIMEEQLTRNSCVHSVTNNKTNLRNSTSRTFRKKPVHKVKSLNISKHFLKQIKTGPGKYKKSASQSSTDVKNKLAGIRPDKSTSSKSPPAPRQVYMEPSSRFNDSESTEKHSAAGTEKFETRTRSESPKKRNTPYSKRHQATATETTVDSESTGQFSSTDVPVSMSTQTTQNIDVNTDTNFMKLAEDKLQNMEKIADLTEKCTKRLSNLAKVLEEVRKNKSLAYSQISSGESTDSQSDKPVVSPITFDSNDVPQRLETKSPESVRDKKNSKENELLPEHFNILADIPKPDFKATETNLPESPKHVEKLDSPLHVPKNTAEMMVKSRPKPPPALSRLSLKHGQEYIHPHELSTVIEVDSPMSTKHKNQSARNDAKEASINSNRSSPVPGDKTVEKNGQFEVGKESSMNPDLLRTKSNLSKIYKFSSTESSDDSKFQMIDLKQFNEIMLEPFISIQEYAKQYNMEPPDEGSNLDDIQRDDAIHDDISSLHSDGSLPDVIAELLKRNIIAEPFKFDTASNINSTTVSSESTLSMLALTKARRGKKKSNLVTQNKENIAETSDTMSFSSNPDLENAFKKLGMGWASSTLKKTKERLALSSSSNTSSSSLNQFKTKNSHQEIPALVSDSVSSGGNVCKPTPNKNTVDNAKNAEQQTTFSNSMTVKEFLRNELAKKITFTNKSNVNDTQEFVSLFETKIPEEMKESSQVNSNERSTESARSGTNRARTSTPVQLFKSLTYRSSSSSNMSNGLFSNANDLSSVKMTSNSIKNHSTSDKDDLTIPTFSLRMKKTSDCSKSD